MTTMLVNNTNVSIPGVGDTMRNGGIILVEKVLRNPAIRESIVLAIVPGAVQPFVTWRRCVQVDTGATGSQYVNDYCFMGYYTNDLERALKDFKKRG